MKYKFAVIDDNGSATFVTAECRTDAIETYCREKGCSKEYVKDHCVVKKYQPTKSEVI